MWNRILGINSFIILPIVGAFFVYAAGHSIILWEWKLLVIATVIFALGIAAEVALGILSD